MATMNREPQFKSTQIIRWESEPKQERPTGFGDSTLGTTQWSTEFGAMAPSGLQRRRSTPRSSALQTLLLAGMTTVGGCAAAVYALMHWLHV
jgi:hypothetical protein